MLQRWDEGHHAHQLRQPAGCTRWQRSTRSRNWFAARRRRHRRDPPRQQPGGAIAGVDGQSTHPPPLAVWLLDCNGEPPVRKQTVLPYMTCICTPFLSGFVVHQAGWTSEEIKYSKGTQCLDCEALWPPTGCIQAAAVHGHSTTHSAQRCSVSAVSPQRASGSGRGSGGGGGARCGCTASDSVRRGGAAVEAYPTMSGGASNCRQGCNV